jgi:thymidylate kinase
LAEAKSGLRVANLLLEEWYRQVIAWHHQRRGHLVIFDRHFYFDYYAHHITHQNTGLSFANRIHGLMLQHIFPKPDLVINLDAPAEVLYARKREGSVELIEMRRQEYFLLEKIVDHFAIVDVSQPKDKVLDQVAELIVNFEAAR